MRWWTFLFATTASVALAAGQQLTTPKPSPDKPAKTPTKPTLSAEERRGLELLEIAETQSRAISTPAMQAFSLWQIGEAYAHNDSKRGISILRDAFQATLAIDPAEGGRNYGGYRVNLQTSILKALLLLDDNAIEELMPEAEAPVRWVLLGERINRALAKKDYDHAISLLYTEGFSYTAAAKLMIALPDQRLSIFGQAVSNFNLEENQAAISMGDDLGTLVVRFWRDLPKKTVLEAIDAMLNRAKDQASNVRIDIASDRGTQGFGSFYEYRLFEMLPILKQLDPERAESLLNENANLKSTLTKYPDGMQSLDPTIRDTPLEKDERPHISNMMMSSGNVPQISGTFHESQQLLANALADLNDAPRQALARSLALPEDFSHRYLRVEALSTIAERTQKSNPSVADDAIDATLNLVPNLPPLDGARSSAQIAQIAQGMGDEVRARKALEAGLAAANRLLEEDKDKDDPNQALPAYWPSTREYARLIDIVQKVSPPWGETVMREIPDDAVRSAVSIAYARALLKVPPTATLVMRTDKKGSMAGQS